MIRVEDWAEIRRLRMSEEVPIRFIARTLGVSRNAVRRALASERPARYERLPRGEAVGDFELATRGLFLSTPTMPATVIAERIGWTRSSSPSESLDLGVVYEALDVSLHPLAAATVEHDLVYLVDRWGGTLTSRYYGRPVIIWMGTDHYTTAEVHAVKAALGKRAHLLVASRSIWGDERVADIVDGEAYYWSPADPARPATTARLEAFSQVVHAHHGLWFAPAASGYDGRTVGGMRVIGRDNGRTLVKSLGIAFASSPSAVAVISWNEWSENTHIEPGKKYGDRELLALQAPLLARGHTIAPGLSIADSSEGDSSLGWTGAQAALTLGVLTVVAALVLPLLGSRGSRRRSSSNDLLPPLTSRSSSTR